MSTDVSEVRDASIIRAIWWWRQHAPLIRRSTSIWIYGSTFQKTLNYRLWLFENVVLKKILRPRREEEARWWVIYTVRSFLILSSLDIIMIIVSRTLQLWYGIILSVRKCMHTKSSPHHHIVFVCSVCFSLQTVIILSNNITQLIVLMVKCCVLFKVRTN
jgi:hypothetical protein